MCTGKAFIRSLAALSLLGVLLLGSAWHAWHHFADPGCGASGSQPCASCSALHGGSIATEPEIGPAPVFQPTAEAPATSLTAPVAAVVRAAPPRGPPSA
jgi:hypothetical protein